MYVIDSFEPKKQAENEGRVIRRFLESDNPIGDRMWLLLEEQMNRVYMHPVNLSKFAVKDFV